MKEYDIIIIGAGCSGLSLAYRFIGTDKKICVFDNNTREDRIRKTWSYWKVYNHPFSHLESQKNNKLKINYETEVELDCSEYNYATIDSFDFDEFIFNEIEKCKNIDIKFNTTINDLKETRAGFYLTISGQEYHSTYVFDSRLSREEIIMQQIFKGIFVKFDRPLESFTPYLMDFSDKDEFHFFYSLPLGDNIYLFETTYYSLSEKDIPSLKEEVHQYINKKYSNQYQVVREEFGKIPLSTKIEPDNTKNNYTNIGISSGATRASTGYTFINIQKQCDEYVKKINNQKFIEYRSTLRQAILRKMDNILLMIIRDHPKLSKKILFHLFERNNNSTVIRFLSDIPKITDIIKIIMNMPKLIFIKYAIKSLYSRKV